MAEAPWTTAMVEERLADAADVLRRLPKVKVQGYFSLWPNYIYEFSDLVGQEPRQLRLPPPPPAAITRMDATLDWLKWLEPNDAKLAWARSDRTPWKMICYRFGISRATANRCFEYALSVIACRLNGQQYSAKQSRRALIERTRKLSSR